MVNASKHGGMAWLMDFNLQMIAGVSFLDKLKKDYTNPEIYHPLDQRFGTYNLMRGSLTANWTFDYWLIKISTLIMTGHLDRVIEFTKI